MSPEPDKQPTATPRPTVVQPAAPKAATPTEPKAAAGTAAPAPASASSSAAPAPAATAEPTAPAAPAPQTAAAQPPAAAPKSSSFAAVVIDTLLVLVLLGAMGGGGWFVYQEMQQYRIPSPIEQELAENKRLKARHDELQPLSYLAETRLQQRQAIEQRDKEIQELRSRLAEGEQHLKDLHNKTLGVQHEIRQADKSAREVARGLMPGLSIGDVTTQSGKRFPNAVIYRVEGSGKSAKLVLRSTGELSQATFPVRSLVQDTLPDIVLYAFGFKDLVSTDDFIKAEGEAEQQQPAADQKKKKRTQAARPARRGRIIVDGKEYVPDSGSPVVDTAANRNDGTAPLPAAPAAIDDGWDAPTGDIPL